jgi:uncharacterized membrane protein YbhN (UPF0104 family)
MLPKFSKLRKTQIKIGVAIFLGLLLVWKLDWHFVLKEFRDLEWQWLVVYVVFQVLAMFFSVKKWQAIASTYHVHFGAGAGMLAYLKGMFLNNFLPTTIGGDAYRCWWLKEKTGKDIAGYVSVLLDRLIGLGVTTVFAFGGGLFILNLITHNVLFWGTYLGILMVLLIGGLVTLDYYCHWNIFGLEKIAFLKKDFFVLLLQKRSWRNLEDIFFWSGAFTVVGLLMSNYLLFLTFGIPLPPRAFSAIMLLVILFSNLPISINNIGIKEWSYATFFVYLGVPIESAVAVALLSRFFQMAISFMAVPITLTIDGETLFKKPSPLHHNIKSSDINEP